MSGADGQNGGVSWDTVLGGEDSWLTLALEMSTRYPKPLPIQQIVAPVVSRALRSGFPMDICLSAPTGSGKTLCYILPMLQMLTEGKRKSLNVTRLRALVLVPTSYLGEQVARELGTLCRGTTIRTLCISGGKESVNSVGFRSRQVEKQLVREARVICEGFRYGCCGEGEVAWGAEMEATYVRESRFYSQIDVLVSTPRHLLWHLEKTPGFSLSQLKLLVIDEADQILTGNFAALVAKVLDYHEKHTVAALTSEGTDSTWLRLDRRQRVPVLHKFLCSATLSTRIARISEVRLRNCRYFALTSEGTALHCSSATALDGEGGKGDENGGALNPLLLPLGDSALSTDSDNSDDDGSSHDSDSDLNTGKLGTADQSQRKREGKDKKRKRKEAANADGAKLCVTPSAFALPPRLQEHIIFVKDEYRHAVLLKLVRQILGQQDKDQQQSAHRGQDESITMPFASVSGSRSFSAQRNGAGARKVSSFEEEKETSGRTVKREEERDDDDNEIAQDSSDLRLLGAMSINGGPVSKAKERTEEGRGVLIFCSTADEARVMGHFLLAAGIPALEFTTTASDSERRQVLLSALHSHESVGNSHPGGVRCVVASDALMRGIDIPDVGHVIMYNPPATLSQYVHRAGRTARATRPGHVYVLLTKQGSVSGKARDGEMAHFKRRIAVALSRALPIRYERTFFLLPLGKASDNGDYVTGAKPGERLQVEGDSTQKEASNRGVSMPKREQRMEPAQISALREEEKHNVELIEEANRTLMRSQLRLRVAWTSAMTSQQTQMETNTVVNTEEKSGVKEVNEEVHAPERTMTVTRIPVPPNSATGESEWRRSSVRGGGSWMPSRGSRGRGFGRGAGRWSNYNNESQAPNKRARYNTQSYP